MRSEREKADIELQVFRDFVRAANLPVDPGSIEKRDPPEPDGALFHGFSSLNAHLSRAPAGVVVDAKVTYFAVTLIVLELLFPAAS